jgi:hypothetical protein
MNEIELEARVIGLLENFGGMGTVEGTRFEVSSMTSG